MTQLDTPAVTIGPEQESGTVLPDGLVRLGPESAPVRRRRSSIALRLVIPAAIFGLWWILTGTGVIPPTTLSTPAATWSAFVDLLRHQDLIGDVGVSVRR